jgi:hypothetical protein
MLPRLSLNSWAQVIFLPLPPECEDYRHKLFKIILKPFSEKFVFNYASKANGNHTSVS